MTQSKESRDAMERSYEKHNKCHKQYALIGNSRLVEAYAIKRGDYKENLGEILEEKEDIIIFKRNRLLEALDFGVSFADLERYMKEDEKFETFMNTKFKDLPEKFGYSIGMHNWRNMRSLTPYLYAQAAYASTDNFTAILSKEDNQPIGWIAYQDTFTNDKYIIFNIKIGALQYEADGDGNPTAETRRKNKEFIYDVLECMDNLSACYDEIYWYAEKDNRLVSYYKEYVEKRGGEISQMRKPNLLQFMIRRAKP